MSWGKTLLKPTVFIKLESVSNMGHAKLTLLCIASFMLQMSHCGMCIAMAADMAVEANLFSRPESLRMHEVTFFCFV